MGKGRGKGFERTAPQLASLAEKAKNVWGGRWKLGRVGFVTHRNETMILDLPNEN